MATLGIIGMSNIGSRIARLATASGLDVVVANSRGPETLAEAVAGLGEHARAATAAEAARAGDWVVVAIPLIAVPKLPVAALAGRIVLDTSNYYPSWRDGYVEELDSGAITTAELVQRYLPESNVVKAFANFSDQHLLDLARPAGAADRSAVPITGNSLQARASAAGLIDRLGYDVVEVGPLSESWRFEPETAASSRAYFADRAALDAGLVEVRALLAAGQDPTVVRFDDPGAPLPADRLRRQLDESTRMLTADRAMP